MAQTDAKTGFRLPWSSDRQAADATDTDANESTEANAAGWPSDEAAPAVDEGERHDAPTVDPWTGIDAGATVEAADASVVPSPAPAAPAPSSRKPSKFLADLTKAMQAAAEDARSRALSQLQADAKSHVEAIHGRSSTEAASLRRTADDDVAAVREWSKAEIARVREETETKITERKARLETEIENHAAVIEREIDAVQKTVATFEDEMAAFFTRLLGEEDPSRFATMAENLPEPPSFEGIVASPIADEPEAVEAEQPVAAVETEAVAEPTADEAADEAAATDETVTEDVPTGQAETTETTETQDGDGSPTGFGTGEGFEGEGEFDGEVDREAAFAAIQAAAEAAASAEVAADAAARAEAVADVAIEIIGNHEEEGEADPRFAALGLSTDYDAAEAEAYAAAGTSDEEIPEISDDAIAARLAGLGTSNGKVKAEGATSSQVIVVGLVSVASIASFKRHLGRVPGVTSVGVSSGPDGEFVFAVSHGADVALRDVIPSLPSFQARVTSSSDGVVHVTAHDPEADA